MVSMYHSTRSLNNECTAKEAIKNGIAPDGGLYVTDSLGNKQIDLFKAVEWDYQTLAENVLTVLLDDYTDIEMKNCVKAAYGDTFDTKEVAPLVKVGDDYILELFRGPTSAFKDVALQMLPQLMSVATQESDERIMILAATSGDTGKAALAGFADTPGLGITVFFPHNGTSEIQRLQMTTQEGKNVAVCAVEGNFDDTQSTVKAIFADEELNARLAEKGIVLSSANSINIGRLAPQVVYYFYAYVQLLRDHAIAMGDRVDFCVPTGNFGDVLAGYYASLLGLPVRKFIVASNKNNILTDFLTTGVYDRNRPFYKTTSPSMDILISSNLERLLYYVSDRDTATITRLMEDLKTKGRYEVSTLLLDLVQRKFECGWANDEEAAAAIKSVFEETGYVMDPHTAVAAHVSSQIEKVDGVPRIILSTASPFKFCHDVCDALGIDAPEDAFVCMDVLEEKSGVKAPAPLANLKTADERFGDVITKEDMPAYVETKCGEIL